MANRIARVALVVVACVIASCTTHGPSPSAQPSRMPIWTQPSRAPDDACMEALGGGTLASDAVSGLGLIKLGHAIHVRWPYGYGARPDGDRLALVDLEGRIVAHVGDVIQTGGGYAPNDIWWTVCPAQPITVLSTPRP